MLRQCLSLFAILTSTRLVEPAGRKPYVDKLGLDKIGVELDDRGRIKVDDNFQTNVKGVHAIGDIISGPMLAHKVRPSAMLACVALSSTGNNIMGWPEDHANYEATLHWWCQQRAGTRTFLILSPWPLCKSSLPEQDPRPAHTLRMVEIDHTLKTSIIMQLPSAL